MTYTPLRRSDVELYGKVGGSIGFNIAGKRTETPLLDGTYQTPIVTRFTSDTPQWAATAHVGLMYKITPSLGIYLEPGVSHFFDMSKQPESFWHDRPTNFNLQVGVRTTF
jgi:hypothetical protein